MKKLTYYLLGTEHNEEYVVVRSNLPYDFLNLLQGEFGNVEFPLIYKQYHGTLFTDFLQTGTAVFYLISQKMKAVLEKNNLTGWKVFPVTILDSEDKEIKGYYGFSITGRAGSIDFTQSEIFNKNLVPNGPKLKYYKGFQISSDQWDGSDFFLSKNYYGIMVSQKAALVLQKNEITNIVPQDISEFEMMDLIVNQIKKNIT
jgi:hypothetical protein